MSESWTPWRIQFFGGPLDRQEREVELLGNEYVEETLVSFLIYDYVLVRASGIVEAKFREEVKRDA